MPLLGTPGAWPRAKLLELLRSQRSDLLETRDLLERPELPIRDPASLRTARDLVDALLALGDATEAAAGVPDALLGTVVNLQYEGGLAAIDLMKSHSDVPAVPRRRS